MDIKVLRLYFNDGALNSAEAVRSPCGKGWLLKCIKTNGDVIHMGTSREPEKPKVFRSLDSLQSASEDIGYPYFKVFNEEADTKQIKLEIQ